MKPFVCLLLAGWCATAAAPPPVAAVIDQARHAPAEFAADSLIRVAALDKLDKSTRVHLLEEAFRRAAQAQQPLRRRAAILRVGGPAGVLNHAYQQQLDALSLRLRAVDELLPLDPAKARALFQQIPRPQVPKLRCDDFLVYDVSMYYEVMGKVADKKQPLRLLQGATLGLTSPSQVEPLARLYSTASVEDADFQTLLRSLSSVIGTVYGDDRAFTASAAATGPQILALVDQAKRRRLSPLPLIEAYRLYLVNNLAGERCADDDLMSSGQTFAVAAGAGAPDTLGSAAVEFFNQKLRTPPLQALREEEITPARIQGAASGLRSCEDAECRQIVALYSGLVFREDGSPFPAAGKNTPEWRDRLDRLLAALTQWKDASGLAAAEQFEEKCQIYSNLLNLAAPGADRDRVVRGWLDYLALNRFERENRMEWFLPVNTLIGRIGLDPGGLGQLSGELRKSRDPVIALYAALEAIAPRTPDRILGLL